MLKTVAITSGSGGSNGTVTNVATGTGLTGGPITTTGTIALANTAVVVGTYGNSATVAAITVNAQGQLTAASNATISVPASAINTLIPNSGLANSSVTVNGTSIALGSSGTITANASSVLTISTGLSGTSYNGGAPVTIALSNTAVTAGTYGNASTVSQVTINAQGQVTNAVNVAISIANSAVTGLGTMSTQNANAVVITGGTINSVAHSGGTFANANITSVAATFPNSYLANSAATIGNTSVALGSTVTNIGNLTLANVTIPSGTVNVQVVNATSTTSSTATFATSSLPLVPAGYIQYNLNGTVVKIPYYAV